jgi:hypothetical protein
MQNAEFRIQAMHASACGMNSVALSTQLLPTW